MNKNKTVLYISYDGILDPLGHSQVFSYLKALSKDINYTLVTFEKPEKLKDLCFLNMKKEIDDLKINWVWFEYISFYKRPMSFIANFLKAAIHIFNLIRKNNIGIVHIRSYLTGLFVILPKIFLSFKLVFDIRGFWVNEKHDRLGWKKTSAKFRILKVLERLLFKISDRIVTLTNCSVDNISAKFNISVNDISVIRTCADKNIFYKKMHQISDKGINLGYLGSVDTAYDIEPVIDFFSKYYQYNNKIQITFLTSSNRDKLIKMLDKFSIPCDAYKIKYVERSQLNDEINSLSCIIFNLKLKSSLLASMPTKIGEAFACGVPIVCNAFNKDIRSIIEKNNCGLILNFNELEFSDLFFKKFESEILALTRINNCIELSQSEFSLKSGSSKYLEIYNSF